MPGWHVRLTLRGLLAHGTTTCHVVRDGVRTHGLVESIEVRQFGDVPAKACNVASDRLYGLVELLLAAARYEDVSAFIDEALRRGQADSRGAAADHGHLFLQVTHHRHSLCV